MLIETHHGAVGRGQMKGWPSDDDDETWWVKEIVLFRLKGGHICTGAS
jgi:hypothetical protein